MSLSNNSTCHPEQSKESKDPLLSLMEATKCSRNATLGKRRLWEFKGPIICRLLGLAFDEDQLNKVLKKVQAKNGQGPSTLPEKHGALVQTCTRQNEVSKYVERMLERRFEPYRKLLEGVDQKDICRFIEGERGSNGLKNIPLSALIWFGVRNQHEEIQEIEAKIFNALHMQEHQSLRLYDALSRELPTGKAEDVLEELKQVSRAKGEFQKRYQRSRQKREQLKLEMETTKKDKFQAVLAIAEQKQLNERLREDLGKLGGQSTLDQIKSLKREIELLNQEIKSLTTELLKQESCGATSIFDELAVEAVRHSAPSASCHSARSEESKDHSPSSMDDVEEEQNGQLSLEGTKVAFVGGLQSLAPHYRQMVESLGGVFCNYSEECRGKREAENLVGSADIVFCPIDINSHGACHCIKRACKLTGKPCCFLRSSGLSMFAKELADFARSLN